jgi:LysM repeat protein
MKNFLFAVLLCFCALSTFAQAKGKMTTHEVVKGETLYSISKKYHVTVDAIEKANKAIGGDMKIKPGQTINIPGQAVKVPTTNDKTATATKTTTKAVTKKASVPVATDKKTVLAATPATDNPSVHTIIKGESLYSLSKMYGVSVAQLRAANNMDENSKLKIGQKLNIPSKNPEAMYKPAPKETKQEVRAEETTISKPYAESKPMQPARAKDELPNDNPPIEKKEVEAKPITTPVKVSEEKPTAPPVTDRPKEVVKEENVPTPKETKTTSADAMANTNVVPTDYVSVYNGYAGSSKKKVVYRGIGSFLKSENPGNQYLALYNYADMGAILKVTNLMSKQSIYVKVIGKVPAADAQNEIILKVSSEAASQLKVSEDKFLVEVTGYNAN